ncbi:unnamed protein product [Caenorhabditis nigoni]
MLSNFQNSLVTLLVFCIFSLFCTIYWIGPSQEFRKIIETREDEPRIIFRPVTEVKTGNKWIVVTSVNYPTDDVKRLAAIPDWNLVVVADTKTPKDWELSNVHFLSVDYQKNMSFSLISSLPYKSYTRKNIGYLYAISHGAEWIYDTDDDNKPYDKNTQMDWVNKRYAIKCQDQLFNRD